jgi:hypothetical protein
MLGNADDPLFQPNTTYTLTVAVGQRNVVNQYGATYGGYDIQLVAGMGPEAVILGRETDVVAPTPGTFVDRTIVVDSSQAAPGSFGQPLSIIFRKTIVGTTADTDFDNVRLSAVPTLVTGDFNADQYIDGRDFLAWLRGFGTPSGAQRDDGDSNNDGDVDSGDLTAWKMNFGETSVAVGTSAPEPTGAIAALIGMAIISTATRRFREGTCRWALLGC